MNFTTKAFSKMTNLRLLKIYRANLPNTMGKMQCKLRISYDFKFHYDELRYLHWDEYPRKSLPTYAYLIAISLNYGKDKRYDFFTFSL